ncbi:E3 ubiquitin-protein ligase RNF168 isoform X1 [Pogona vitticeps]|nr:E3 ubiquitin-protein ligase RNF168 isoform X1 [Pogona vitticeps]XP_020642034.1 E3 ubiquitin-protein ligase RNF168 isoform X1 [Pogona vitticeps]
MSKQSEAPLSLSDCRCNICMDIFLEPVTLPCHHTLCNSCFQLTVEKASLCCPFCRRRVSSWARYNARKNTLINSEFWEKIQKYFPEECQRRINGQDLEEDSIACIPQPVHCLSKPGELRQEYEAEISKAEAERHAYEQEERRASEAYIQRLLAEEEREQRLAEEKKKHMTEQLLHDEMLARELSFSLNRSAKEHIHNCLSSSPSPSDSCQTSKSKSSSSGDIKIAVRRRSEATGYFSPKSCNAMPRRLLFRKSEEEKVDSFSGESNKSSFTSEEEKKENEMPALSPQTTGEARNIKDGSLEPSVSRISIFTTTESSPNLSHFSSCQADELSSVPHRETYVTPCHFSKGGAADCDFKNGDVTDHMYLTKNGNFSTQESDSLQGSSITTSAQAKIGSTSVENKSRALNLTTEEIPKRKSQESPSEEAVEAYINEKRRRTSSQSEDDMSDIDVQQQISLEQQLYERYKQEEEDRRLALKLQKELDKEQKTLNRKKGSPDEYLLRPTTSQSAKESPSVKKLCRCSKNSKSTNRQSEIDKKLHRGLYNENLKSSNKVRKKSSIKGGNVLNGVLNRPDSKDAELLPSKQKTILQMFERPATN